MSIDEQALTDAIIQRRLMGWLIDALVVGMALLALHVVFFLLGFLTFGLTWFLIGGLWVVPVAYIFLFIASPGQATPGQAMAGLAVVRDDDLGRPTPAQALVYAAGYAITMWAGAFWLLIAFFTRRGRCLHDIVAGVAVVRSAALGAPPPIWTAQFGR